MKDGTPMTPVGSPEWCTWALSKIELLEAELHLLEEVCAFYANDEDAALDDGEPYGSIPTEVGLTARAARRRFQAREAR